MKKILKILAILFIATGIGLYFGFRYRTVEVVVYRSSDDSATTTELQVTPDTSFVLKGEQLPGSFGEEVLGAGYQEKLTSLPWFVSRASAITAYLLMFIIIVWGAGMTTGFIYGITNPVEAWTIHKYLSISMGVMVLLHIASLLFDKIIKFTLIDLLVPFAADYKPLFFSLGIVGFYVVLIIIFTSLFLRVRLPRLWRDIHYLVYPLFIITLVHGLYMGFDAKTTAMQAIYWTTGIIFALISVYRFVYFNYQRRRL